MSDQQARIMNEAGEWWLRRSEARGEMDGAFEDWLAADPAHVDAYARLAATWEDMGTSPTLGALADAQSSPLRRATSHTLVLGALAMAAGLAAFFMAPGLLDPPQARYATVVAELERVTLADGSVVTVGAASQIEVRMSAQERRVHLRGGEAFFEVAHDPARPFFVEAGDTQVRVVGTKFDVRRNSDSVAIAVREGLVRVHRGAQEEIGLLRAGERVDIIRPALLTAPPPATITPINTAPAGAWVSGRLNYNDTRLADVVADINRYYAPGVRLNPDARELRVTAGFATSEIGDFMDLISDVVPVDVERRGDGSYQVDVRE
ncbi:MAG TPA: FecR domain-containing protein [Verrucomicrobiae bacterium]|nr:FecR domain-containing protein [Verrucomicrobiae bacterium]